MVKENTKDKYLQSCLERRHYFTPILYSANGTPVTEAVDAHRCLASLLSKNLKWEYSEMYGFIRAKMSLAIVKSNTLLLQGARYKNVYINHILDMVDGAVMALIVPWQG